MRTRRWFRSAFRGLIVGSLAAAALTVGSGAAPAGATPANNAAAAVGFANGHGYHSAIGVMDVTTGAFWGAGDYNSAYASESVMKLFIATRLLLTNQMSGWNETTAYKMITQSDDASADALYGRAGGDGVITWVKQALNLPTLGSPPLRNGWWGGTQINAHGMSLFYQAVRSRSAVWGWLGNAMHHASRYGSDGQYQYFGIPSATTSAAIKQGWGGDNAAGQPAFNSTGVVNGDRYAVVILTQGGIYGSPIADMVTAEARLLMPGGRIARDDPDGHLDSLGVYGNHATVRGWAYDPNVPTSAVKIVVYVNGRINAYRNTDVSRPDINAARGITGTHGYAVGLNLVDGANRVCVYATNLGAGQNTTLACTTVYRDGTPIGTSSVSVTGNLATVSGWAYDYDVPNDPSKIVINVNGHIAAYGATTLTNPGVNAGYRISGAHGYSFGVRLPDGVDSVCTYAINRGPGVNAALGCSNQSISGSPLGRVDSVTLNHGSSGSTATVVGWTYDYDFPTRSVQAVLYRNGRLAAYGATAIARPDVNSAFGITGAHGYSFTIGLASGTNTLCMYGSNMGAGLNSTLGCRSVTG